MKKAIFAVLLALVMVFAMTACGDSGPQTYAGFYSAVIPDGFVTDEFETEFTRDSEAHEGEEEIIQVYVRYGDAEEEINDSIAYWADSSSPHQRLDDVTYGDITWFVEEYTWGNDDAASCVFYTNTEDGNFIEVNFFLLGHDNEEVVAMMESFTFEEGAYDKSYDFVNAIYAEE